MSGPLKRIIGITGDRVFVTDTPTATEHTKHEHEELQLYVNSGGAVLALTTEQVALRHHPTQTSDQ